MKIPWWKTQMKNPDEKTIDVENLVQKILCKKSCVKNQRKIFPAALLVKRAKMFSVFVTHLN